MIKKFDEYINESVRDLMKPKSTEDITKVIEKMPPYKALATAYKYELPEVIKVCQERIKPINVKLYQDTKKFNKSNIDKFMDFVCTWVDSQDGNSYDVQETFEIITLRMGTKTEKWYEYWDEEQDEFDQPSGERTTESIYSDNTIEMYKQLVISYAIDEVSHNINENYIIEMKGFDWV